jgi:hypothetical protein
MANYGRGVPLFIWIESSELLKPYVGLSPHRARRIPDKILSEIKNEFEELSHPNRRRSNLEVASLTA